MKNRHRVLVISHGHPDIAPGGGEHAAYSLFRELRDRAEVESLFLAPDMGTGQGRPGAPFALHSSDGLEMLFTTQTDQFRFSQRDSHLLCRDFRRLLESFRPTVVHLHHYTHVGVELLREIRNYSATVPLVLTLHEYLAICHNNGQMIKPETDELCRSSSPAKCHRCFPNISSENFFLRELYIKSFFRLVDVFIAPSQFLIDRYAQWGLPRDKLLYLENGQPKAASVPPRPLGANGLRGRFAFFGQISRYKGIHVLLEAMSMIPKKMRGGTDGITLDIHGGNLHYQTQQFRDQLAGELQQRRDFVRMHGRYDRADLPSLMRSLDWIVVPSIWWENSPLVIQEALGFGRPIICSDIGGMAEKVIDGKNGLHFRVGNPRHLADRLMEAATSQGLWDRLQSATRPGPSIHESTDRHLELYDRLSRGHRASPQVHLQVV